MVAGNRRGSSVPLLFLAAALLLGPCSRGSCSSAARTDTVIDVRQMGAKGDGVANDTASIASAFAAASSASAAGGTVTVRLPGPAVYMVDRPLSFAANHSLLSVEAGAVLRYHWDPDKILSFYDWPSYAVMLTVGPPSGGRLVNVSLGGGGIVDGQGFMHWPYVYHYRGEHGRPYMFVVHGIDQLVIEHLTLLNPPMITFNGPCGCNDVVMRHLNLTAAWLLPDEFYNPKHSPLFPQWRHTAPTFPDGAPTMNGTCGHERGGSRIWADAPTKNYCEPANTDGIDPGCGSKNVHIHDVFIENGDDSVVMKPGWGKERPAGCTRDILVENVTIFRGMGANVGGLGSGCVDNVTFRNITLDHASLAGIEIKTEHGGDNNSFVSNVLYEDIKFIDSMNSSCCPCTSITAQYGGPGAYPGKFLPRIFNVTYRRVDQRGCNTPVVFECNEAAPCENIILDGIQTSADTPPFQVNWTDCVASGVTGGGVATGCKAPRL